jgi:hypothetical protein
MVLLRGINLRPPRVNDILPSATDKRTVLSLYDAEYRPLLRGHKKMNIYNCCWRVVAGVK